MMSIQSEITRIETAKAAIKTAIEGKGVTVPDGTLLDGMAALIESIEAGGAKITTGTFVPLGKTLEIVHGLGVIPDYVIFYIEETRTETSRTTVNAYATTETTIKTPVMGSGYFQSLFGAFRVSDRHFARTTFSGASELDWGYYTICDVNESGVSSKLMLIDENRFYNLGETITPFSVDGLFTIRWFAIAGVAE